MVWSRIVVVALLLAATSALASPDIGAYASESHIILLTEIPAPRQDVLEGLLLDKIAVLEQQVLTFKGWQESGCVQESEKGGPRNITQSIKSDPSPKEVEHELHEAFRQVKEAVLRQEATQAALVMAKKREEKLEVERESLRKQLHKVKRVREDETKDKGSTGNKLQQAELLIKELRGEVEALRSENSRLVQNSKLLQAQVFSSTRASQALHKTSETTDMQNHVLSRTLKDVESQLTGCEKRFGNTEVAERSCRGDADNYAAKVQTLSKELEEMTAKALMLAAGVAEEVEERRSLMGKMQDAMDRAEDGEQDRARLQAKLDALTETHKVSREASEQLTAPLSREELLIEVRKLGEQKDDAEAKVTRITARLHRAEKEATEMKEQFSALVRRNEELMTELRGSRKQVELLGVTDQALQSRVVVAEGRLCGLLAQLEEERRAGRDWETERIALRKRIDGLEGRIERAQAEKLNLQSEAMENKEVATHLQSQCDAVSRENALVKERVGQLKGRQNEESEKQVEAWGLVKQLKHELAEEREMRERESKRRREGNEDERVLQVKVDGLQRRLYESEAQAQRLKQVMRVVAAEKEEAVLLHNVLQLRLDECCDGGKVGDAGAVGVPQRSLLARAVAAFGVSKVEQKPR